MQQHTLIGIGGSSCSKQLASRPGAHVYVPGNCGASGPKMAEQDLRTLVTGTQVAEATAVAVAVDMVFPLCKGKTMRPMEGGWLSCPATEPITIA